MHIEAAKKKKGEGAHSTGWHCDRLRRMKVEPRAPGILVSRRYVYTFFPFRPSYRQTRGRYVTKPTGRHVSITAGNVFRLVIDERYADVFCMTSETLFFYFDLILMDGFTPLKKGKESKTRF